MTLARVLITGCLQIEAIQNCDDTNDHKKVLHVKHATFRARKLIFLTDFLPYPISTLKYVSA